MANWQIGLALLVVVWALQAVGTWVQMRHYRRMMGDIARRWPDGWLGAGNARGTLSKGVIAVVVVTPDEIVRCVHLMEGRSVFAKFRQIHDFDGMRLDALKDEPFPAAEKARNKAMAMAIAQIRKAQTRKVEAAPSGEALRLAEA